MYISNPDIIKSKIGLNKRTANYLINQHQIPLLSQEDGIFYFSETDKLKNALADLPLWLKIFK